MHLGDCYLHMTLSISVSSKAEFCNRGFDPSHLSSVPSSSGCGLNVSIDITLPFNCDVDN